MKRSPPFSIQALKGGDGFNHTAVPGVNDAAHFWALLPASSRAKTDDISTPSANLHYFLEKELFVKRINAIQDWLWACGRPMPPRPLHYQLVLSRDIIVTEAAELHLVWGPKGIHVKPLPEYLLDREFWQTHIIGDGGSEPQEVEKCARGFLFSYCALIAYKSDFRIAKDHGLLPENLSWESWKLFSAQILESHCFAAVNPRYWYGELRLGRLNKVYRFRKLSLFRGYSRIAGYAVYGDLIRDNFAALITLLGYVVIVLTAMQVGLATDKLVANEAFQAASYGLTVFAIIGPLIAGVSIILFAFIWILSNWRATKRYEGRRFKDIGVEPYWRD